MKVNEAYECERVKMEKEGDWREEMWAGKVEVAFVEEVAVDFLGGLV